MTDRIAYADRSERGKLKLTGPQRAWFLHQILTQSFDLFRGCIRSEQNRNRVTRRHMQEKERSSGNQPHYRHHQQ
jgi:folate-binding Fe-S cluster repair protein YgfZ